MGGKTKTSWKKGQSGNPHGRPKKEFTVAEKIRAILKETSDENDKRTYLEIFARRVVFDAIRGDPTARKIVMQYVDGLPIQKIKMGGDNEMEPLQIIIDRK